MDGGREIKASCRPKKEKNLFVTKPIPCTKCTHTTLKNFTNTKKEKPPPSPHDFALWGEIQRIS